MALASFSPPHSWQETRRSGSSVVLSVSRSVNPEQARISAGFSEIANHLQEQLKMMAEWQNFISAIRTEPDNIEKEIVILLPPKSRKIIKAKVRYIERPSILIAEDDIR